MSFINGLPPLKLLNYMAVAVIVLFLLKGLFNFLQSYLMSDIGQLVVRDVRALLYSKLQSLSLDYFIRKRGGELISRITNDVKLIENAVSYGSTDLEIPKPAGCIIYVHNLFYSYKNGLDCHSPFASDKHPNSKSGQEIKEIVRQKPGNNGRY